MITKIKVFMVVCLLGIAATASAQFANSKGSSSGSGDTNEWQGLRISYNPITMSPDKGDDIGLTGFSAGYIKGFSLSQNTPIFLEAGANLLWANKDLTEDDEDETVKLNMLSINIPVSFGYKYTVNDNFSIFPYIGLNFRINALGKLKSEYEEDGKSKSESIDVFNKNDMKKQEQDAWKRFQAGWQIGIAFNINKFTLAASYGKDFTEISKKVKITMPSITVGLNF